MKTAFIIHGAYGSPNENWITWLEKELGKTFILDCINKKVEIKNSEIKEVSSETLLV
ncbi:hypothetical protein ACFLY7_02680 [Patescibacteria group bacterium]